MKKKILLYGYNEAIYDKIVDEKGNFDRVIKEVHDLKSRKESFNIIIKATKFNFFCLDKIISFACQLIGRNKPKKIKFSIIPLKKLSKNFQIFVNKNNKILRKDGISIVSDKELLELLNVLKKRANNNNDNDLLRLLGIICETTFIGPKQLLIDVKNRCNSDCIFCWIHSPLIREKMYNKPYYKKPKEINLDSFKRIIDDAVTMKVEEIVLVGDGEPTIHKRFPEMIEYTNKKGLKTMLFSNGLLLDKYFKIIADNNVTYLELTISAATQKTYKNLHPSAKKCSLNYIKDSIKNLSKYKERRKKTYPKITIVNVINNKNYNEIIKMTKFAKEVGADEVTFKLIDLRDFSMFLKLNGEQIKVVKRDIRKAKELAKEINIEIQDHLDFQLENINVKTGNWSENVYTKTGCFIGWWFAYYRLDDVFTFCCSIKEVDRLKDKSFKDIWFSDDYNKFRIAGKYLSENRNLEFKDKRKLFEPKCNNCDNTGHLNIIQNLLKECGLEKFVFSSKKLDILLPIYAPTICH